MKKLALFLFFFISSLFANSTVIVPIANNSAVVTDKLIVNFRKQLNVDDLKSIKYSNEDFEKDAKSMCSEDYYKYISNNKPVFDIYTNDDGQQIALMYYASCNNFGQNNYVIVKNGETIQNKNVIISYHVIDKLGRTILSSKEILQRDINVLCSHKNSRDFLKKEKHIILFINTNGDKTAFAFSLVNKCPNN